MAEVRTLRPAAGPTLRAAADRFLASGRCSNRNTRRAYAGVLDRLADRLGPDRLLATVPPEHLAEAVTALWGQAAASTWNQRRAAVGSWLDWCARTGITAPRLPAALERRRESPDETRALPRAAIERLLTRRDIPLREKTLWRMLYETAARCEEILRLDIADLDLEGRRGRVTSKGGAVEWVYWATGTAHLLPRLLRGRTDGPVFLAHRKPPPARRPPARDLAPDGRARLGYDRARVLLDRYTAPGDGRPGWDPHQLRHSAATHLGEDGVPLQLIMAKLRHKNPKTAMRYVRPGPEAVAEVTERLDLASRRRGGP